MDRESLIRSVGEYATQGIAIGDANPDDGAVMTFFWVNDAFSAITGFAPDRVLGRTAGILAGETTDPVIRMRIIRQMQAWETFTEHLELTRPDGRSYWGELTFRLVEEQPGRRFWVLLVRNVSEQVQAKAKISDLARVAHVNTDLVALIDSRQRVVWCNAAFSEFSGIADVETQQPPIWGTLTVEAVSPGSPDSLTRKLSAGAGERAKLTLTGAGEERRVVDADFRPIIDEVHGRTDGHIIVMHDISAQERIDSRYRAIVRETSTAIAVIDGDRFLMVNKAFAEMVGEQSPVRDGDLLEAHATSLLVQQVLELAAQVLADGMRRSDEITTTDHDGRAQHLHLRSFRTHDALARRDIVCLVVTDITKVRETEARLSTAEEELVRQQSRFWAAIDASPDGLVLCDTEDRLVHCNAAFRQMLGSTAGEVEPGMTYRDIAQLGLRSGVWDVADEDAEVWLESYLSDRRAGLLTDRILKRRDGRSILCRESRLRNGEWLSIWIDATEMQADKDRLRVAQRAAKRAEARLTSAIEALDDQLAIFDPEDRLVIANKSDVVTDALGDGSDPLGLTFEEILRSAVYRGFFTEASGREEEYIEERIARHRAPAAPMIQRLSDGRVFKVIEKRTALGDTVSLRVDMTLETRQKEELQRYADELRASHNLLEERNTALLKAREALEHRSLHDPLTDLPNRRYLDRELSERAGQVGRGGRLAILQIDLDRFKQVNDAYGHSVGDKVLINAAQVLRDRVGPGDLVARVGGDEFLILTSDPDLLKLGDKAQSIINAMAEPFVVDGLMCRIGASVGIAMTSDHRPDQVIRQLPSEADIALYAAKRQGRNRWVIFSPDLRAETVHRQRLIDALTNAISEGALEPVYQPQVRANGETLVGVEALLRWNDPNLGIVDPTTVLAVAQETGLEAQLDKALFERILADDTSWRAAGVEVPKIALNVTGRRLRSPQLVEDIRKSGIAPERLTIEVLETIFVDGDDRVLTWNIDQLREMGVFIALDDFGTGHSSIIGVLKLKPHAIKIDKSFVDQALGVREAELLVASVIQLGKSLGLEVVAEGVETREQAEQLRALGCDTFQGYVFGAPMTAADIGALFGSAKQSAAPRG